MERRSFLLGLVGALAAPAIIRPGILMPVRKIFVPEPNYFWWGPDTPDFGDLIANVQPIDTPLLRVMRTGLLYPRLQSPGE